MDIIKNAKKAIDITSNALNKGALSLDSDFIGALELIKLKTPPGRLIVMGMGKSGHIGAKLSATFASTGTPSFFVHPAEAGHGDLGMITDQDVVLAISQSGGSEEILKVLPFISKRKIELISLTGKKDSILGSNSKFVIDTSVEKEACPLDLAPTASTSLALALGDALAVCLLESRGFTQEDFASTHPLGTLGKKLVLTVKDIMSDFNDTAKIYSNNTIKEGVMEISKAGLGFVTVINDKEEPISVFTDGDLRRCLDKDLNINNTLISEIMVDSFHTINESKLAINAVNLMTENKVSGLPVIDESGKLTGSINMRQLLQSGVI
tara:strand:- start:199 stop:1167 length:969 start_codon:yes stop_codon:yes gene_type:complete